MRMQLKSKQDVLPYSHLSAKWDIGNLSPGGLENKYEHVGATETSQVVSLMNIPCVCYFVEMQESYKHQETPVFLNPCNLIS